MRKTNTPHTPHHATFLRVALLTMIVGGTSTLAQQMPVTVVHRNGQLHEGSPTAIDFTSESFYDWFSEGYMMTDRGPVWTGSIGEDSSGVFFGFPSQLLFAQGDVISNSPLVTRTNMFAVNDLYFTRSGRAYSYKSRSNTSPVESETLHTGTLLNGIRRVAGVGDPLPGGGGSAPTFSVIHSNLSAGVNDSGLIIYRAKLTGNGTNANNDELLVHDNGQTAGALVREGDSVPGLSGVTFDFTDFLETRTPQVSSGGDIIFLAKIKGTGITTSNNQGLFKTRVGQSPQILLRTGNTAPGYPSTHKISRVLPETILTASGYLSSIVDVDTGSGSSIKTAYVFSSTGWAKHISTGDQAPGFTSEWRVHFLDYSRIGETGKIITGGHVKNTVTEAIRWALWYGPLGNPQLIASEGMVAPGLGNSQLRFDSDITPYSADFNNLGDVVFHASASAADETIPQRLGLWTWDAVRGLRLVVVGSIEEGGYPLEQLTTTNSPSPYFWRPNLLNDAQTAGAGTLDNAGNMYFAGTVLWNLTGEPYTDSLFLANLRASGYQALPAFRPTQAAAVESPLVLTTHSYANDNYRIRAYRVDANGMALTGDLGYLNSPGSKLVGSGDFNQDKVLDLFWYNENTGYCTVWIMNDGGQWPSRVEWLPTRLPSTLWRPITVCDMNRDGTPDIVWQHQQTHSADVWLVARTSSTTLAVTSTRVLRGGDGLPWKLAAAADMSGDGQPDLLFRYEDAVAHPYNGAMFLWKLNNLTFDGLTWMNSNVDLGWKLIGVADADRDGGQDVIWWWTGGGQYNGAISYWRMSGTRYLETRSAWSTINPDLGTISKISPVLP